MHPIERLRYVVRSGGADDRDLARETAVALIAMADDPAGMVLSCKRLLDRHPASGPLWSLAARVLSAGDPGAEAWRFVDELDGDATARHLAAALPDGARVTVLGWPEVVADALPGRGDVAVLVVDAAGEAASLVRALHAVDVDATDVPESGTGAAVVSSEVLVLDARACGPGELLAVAGSRAAAATARHAGVPVWAAVAAGRRLPGPLWDALVARARRSPPWTDALDVVPLDLVEVVVGPDGAAATSDDARRPDCPIAAELCNPIG